MNSQPIQSLKREIKVHCTFYVIHLFSRTFLKPNIPFFFFSNENSEEGA